jgi:hypothetical protein
LRALSKYHDGINSVRERMGYKSNTKPQGYWNKWENVERELQEVTDQLGHFPEVGELRRLRRHGLVSTIYQKYSGFDAVRERMGYSPSRQEQSQQLSSLLEQYASGGEE